MERSAFCITGIEEDLFLRGSDFLVTCVFYFQSDEIVQPAVETDRALRVVGKVSYGEIGLEGKCKHPPIFVNSLKAGPNAMRCSCN